MLIVQLHNDINRTHPSYHHVFYLFNDGMAIIVDKWGNAKDGVHRARWNSPAAFVKANENQLTTFRMEIIK